MIKTSIKRTFNKNKKLIDMSNVDINKIVISKKESYGKKGPFKYFIGYDDNDDIKPLCIMPPQMTG